MSKRDQLGPPMSWGDHAPVLHARDLRFAHVQDARKLGAPGRAEQRLASSRQFIWRKRRIDEVPHLNMKS